MGTTSGVAEAYREGARRRRAARERAAEDRRHRAWDVARQAADMLRGRFGARQVVVFGSLVSPRRFHLRSDVDLAVWGLPEPEYFRAVAALLSLDPDIPVDLVEAEHARPALLAAIETEGIPL